MVHGEDGAHMDVVYNIYYVYIRSTMLERINYPSLRYLRQQTPNATFSALLFHFLPQPSVSYPRTD